MILQRILERVLPFLQAAIVGGVVADLMAPIRCGRPASVTKSVDSTFTIY